MKKSILILLLIIICSIICFAQSDSNSAPVNWEKRNISKANISIMFPEISGQIEF